MSAQVPTTRKVLTSPWQPIIIDSNLDGAAVDIPDLATVGITSLINNWMFCFWIFIISMEIDTGALLSIKFGTAKPVELQWSPTELIIAQGYNIQPTALSRVTEQWVLLTLYGDSNIYASTWTKGQAEKYAHFSQYQSMEFPAYLKVPVGVGQFKIRYI